jgi:hypothetical protein
MEAQQKIEKTRALEPAAQEQDRAADRGFTSGGKNESTRVGTLWSKSMPGE